MPATSVGQIGLDLVVNQKQFNKQMKSMDSVALKFGKKLGGALMAGFSVKKIVEVGAKCVELGSDLQEVENVVGVTFPSMSAKIDKFAKDAAGSFGLSETMAKKYSSTLGSMAKSFGFTETKAYSMGTTLAGLAGDVASFYNMSQDEAYTKLKSVFTGETESLKDLGVVMTQSALDAYALANGFGKTTSAMSEAEKVALRYAFVQDKLSAAQGDFARTSDSWANQTKVLSLQFESLKATIGQGLIAAFTPVIKVINTLLQKVQVLATSFKNLMEGIFGAQTTETSVLSSTAEAAALAAKSTADSTGATADNLKKANKFLAGFDVVNKLSDTSSASSSSGSSSIASTIGGSSTEGLGKTSSFLEKKFSPVFEKTLKKVNKQLTKFKDTFSKFFKDIKKAAAPFVDYIAGPFVEMVGAGFGALWEDCIKPVFGFIEDVFYDFAGVLNTFWNNWASPIVQNLEKAFNKWAEAWSVAWNSLVKPTFDTFMDCLDELWDKHMAPLVENFGNLVGEFINGALEIYSEFIVPLVEFFSKLLAPVIQKFVTDTSALIGLVIDILNGITTSCKGIIQFVTGVFTGDWEKAWTGVKNIFKGIFESLVALVKKPVNAIIDCLNGMIAGVVKGINTVIKAINSISLKIPDWVPEVGGKKIGFNLKTVTAPEIPKLANGAFVKANTPQLAIIGDNRHQGEVVAPEDKLTEMAMNAVRAASGNDYSLEILKVLKEILEVLKTIDFDIVIDGKKLKDIIVEKINQHTAQTGVCEIIM